MSTRKVALTALVIINTRIVTVTPDTEKAMNILANVKSKFINTTENFYIYNVTNFGKQVTRMLSIIKQYLMQ